MEFMDIIGYEDIKRELRMIIDILQKPEKYIKLGVKQPKGLLLYGKPGVGKTTMAKCFVKATGRQAFICRKKKPDGEFVKEITEIFEKAKENMPSVILLDDMDKYANEDKQHKNAEEFVTIQACIDDAKDMDIFVIATANSTDAVPDSLLRPGRFDKNIEINNPKRKDAAKIAEYYLSKKSFASNVDAEGVAEILGGESCAQIETVVNEAGIYAGFENKDEIDMDDMIKACIRVIYDAPEKEDPEEEILERIAYHEAGHALVSELLSPGSVTLVSVRANHGKTGGFNSIMNSEDYWYSKKKMENKVISLLAGKAATEIVFGCTDVGVTSDLHKAFDIVERFVDNYCSNGFDRWIQGRDSSVSNELLARRDMQMTVEMERFYMEAKRILVENREKLQLIANTLMSEKTIAGTRLRNIINVPEKEVL